MNVPLTSLCIYIEANSTGKSNLEEDHARKRKIYFSLALNYYEEYIYIYREIYVS